jgi:TP901 family phage tail tape measure protein
MTRVGASQAFFNIVAQFQADKLIADSRSKMTAVKAVMLDSFEALFKPLDDLTNQIDVAINAVTQLGREVALARVEFEKFYDGANMSGVSTKLIEIGESYGVVADQALAAGSRAAQVGNIIGNENIPKLVKQANILTEISDLTAEESMRGLISLNQQAGIAYGELTKAEFDRLEAGEQGVILNENLAHSLNVLNTVANRSVALEGDLVKTMTNFSAQAKLAGDSFEYMSAMSAVLLEAGEEHGASGRALRMIYARLGGDINGAATKLEQMNITVRDAEGNMLPLQKVLEDMKRKGWDELTPALKQNIAQTIAGNRHYVRFLKLMENYDRSVQLATAAQYGLDDALQQANKARESEVRMLEIAEARYSNLKGQMGEAMMPFQRGVVTQQANFLDATLMLDDAMGGLSHTIGRLYATLKMGEGFIKFGLMIQSMGIGLEMFDSVTRQLHGLEVAVNNLHSKQATYLKYNEKMSKDQERIAKYMLYLQQRKNAQVQKEGHIRAKLSQEQRNISKLEAQVAHKQEYFVNTLKERIVHTQAHFNLRNQMMLAEGQSEDRYFNKVRARLEYETATGNELLNTYNQIYITKKTAEEAYMRQMVADYEIIGKMSDDEVLSIRARKEELEKVHSALQKVKSANELARTPSIDGRKGVGGNLFTQAFGGRNTIEFKAAMKEVERMNEEIQAKAGGYEEKDTRDVAEMARNSAKNMQAFFDDMKSGSELSAQGFHGMKAALKKLLGETMHAQRTLDLYEASQKDLTLTTKELADVEKKLAYEKDLLKGHQKELKDLTMELDNAQTNSLGTEQELEKAIEAKTQAILEQANAVQMFEKDAQNLTRKQEVLMKELRKNPEYQAEYSKSLEDTKKSFGRFALAGANATSMLFGMVGGTKSAAVSMALMTANIMPAINEVTKAGKGFFQTQMALYQTARQSGHTGKAIKDLTTKILASSLAFAAVGGAILLLNERSEMLADALKKAGEGVESTRNSLQLLSDDSNIITDEKLANMLDLSGVKASDLQGDINGIEDALQKLEGAEVGLDDMLARSVDEARTLLTILKKMESGEDLAGMILNEDEFDRQVREIENIFSGASGAYEEMTMFRRDQKKAIALIRDIGGDIGRTQEYGMGGIIDHYDVTAKGLAEQLVEYIRAGNQLTKEQYDMLGEIYDSTEITNLFDSLDDLILSEQMAAYHTDNLGKEMGDTNEKIQAVADDVKNLTQEIYDFGNAREELFFGGKYGNVTGSLYKQVVQQGVGTLYHKNEVIMSNNFHGFFNEEEAASRIIAILDRELAKR